MTLTQITEKGIKDGEIVNADINASAAIARTKLANVDLVDDSSPQLGGDLDLNGSKISVGDGGKDANQEHIRFGNDGDLRIYHDGTLHHSYIHELGTGNLRIRGQNVEITDTTGTGGGNTMAAFIQGGSAKLYNNNNLRLEVTDQGANLEGNGSDHYILDLHNTGSGKGSQIQFRNDHDASANIGITGDTTGDLRLYTEKTFKVQHGTKTNLKSIPTDGVELYHNSVRELKTFDLGLDIGTNATGNYGLRWGGESYNYTNIWTEYGSGDLFLAGGLKPKTTNNGFYSSYTGSFSRNAIQIDAFGNAGIHFYTSAAQNVTKDDAITVPERMRIEEDGDLRISSDDVGTNYGFIDGWNGAAGNLIIGADQSTTGNASSVDGSAIILRTRGGERARIQHAGGISFNGDTAQANALDDYEEGTFTPVMYGSTTAGTPTHTYQNGIYTKIGRQITVSVNLAVTALGGAAGNMRISGFPFTPKSGTEGVTVAQWNQLGAGLPSGTANACPILQNPNTFLEIRCNNNAGSVFTVLPVQTVLYFRFIMTYFTA